MSDLREERQTAAGTLSEESLAAETSIARSPLWWAFSLVLHLVFVLLLILNTPLRKLFEREPKTQVEIDPERFAEIVERLRERQRQKLAGQLIEFHTLVEKLDETRGQKARGLNRVAQASPRKINGDLPERAKKCSIERIYLTAQELEADVTAIYRHIRACELMQVQELEFEEALKNAPVETPTREQIDVSLLTQRIVSNAQGEMDRLKQTLNTIENEMRSMILRTQHFLRLHDEGLTVYSEGWGRDEGGQSLLSGGDALNRWGNDPYKGPALLPHEVFPSEYSEQQFTPLPGRKLVPGGSRHDYMYVDSWWLLGPFPNGGLNASDQVYPPEVNPERVNLDAIYQGKNDATIRWRYMRAFSPRIWPSPAMSNATYFFFTELYSPEQAQYYFALGGDDNLKIWVDGKLAYTSAERVKAYRYDEGVERFTLKKGHTPILVKLNNYGGTVLFSMFIRASVQ